MGVHKDYQDGQLFSDLNHDEQREGYDSVDVSDHKRRVRRLIEDHLEQKRLQKELEDEFDGEFDWDDSGS